MPDKRPVLTLKKPLSLEKQAQIFLKTGTSQKLTSSPEDKGQIKVPDKTPQLSQEELTRQRKQKAEKTLEWLAHIFPRCFSLGLPRPLKLTINKDLLEAMHSLETTAKMPSRKSIPRALRLYTTSLSYHQAILNHPHRINLHGEEEGVVTEQQRCYAQKKMIMLDQKLKEEQDRNVVLPLM